MIHGVPIEKVTPWMVHDRPLDMLVYGWSMVCCTDDVTLYGWSMVCCTDNVTLYG